MKTIFTSCMTFLFFCAELAAQKNIVFLVGERYNSASQTMPALAVFLEDKYKHKTQYLNIPKNGPAENIKLIEKADLLICYFQLRNLPDDQINIINKHIESGKPVISFNSTNQAFEKKPTWFAKYFGGAFRGKTTESDKSTVTVIPEEQQHPIFKGLESYKFSTNHPTTIPGPLHKNATPLLVGKSGTSPAFPVAWTFTYKKSRIFYTSLGTADDFKNSEFLKIIHNAVNWCLSGEEAKKIEEKTYPAPPPIEAPEDAVLLFDGSDLNHWKHWDLMQRPHSITIDGQIQRFSNITRTQGPNWALEDGVIISRPGFGDIITKKSFGNYILNVDFLIPEEPDYVDKDTRGSGGIFISGRYELRINSGNNRSRTGPNSIYTLRSPDFAKDMKPGVWHNMKIHYKHLNNAPADITVYVNGSLLHQNTKLQKPTPYGIIKPISKEDAEDLSLHTFDKDFTKTKIPMGRNDFSIAARFKTISQSGTIFARTSETTGWERDGKAFFLGKGEIYYDIGWKSVVKTGRKVNDGKWHHAVLTNTEDMCTMYVDGEVAFMKKKFNAPDPDGHVLKIGYEFKNFYRLFKGEISNLRYYNRALSYNEVIELTEKNTSPENPVIDWRPEAEKKIIEEKVDKEIILKGPIRLHGDFSRIRYANIWLKER